MFQTGLEMTGRIKDFYVLALAFDSSWFTHGSSHLQACDLPYFDKRPLSRPFGLYRLEPTSPTQVQDSAGWGEFFGAGSTVFVTACPSRASGRQHSAQRAPGPHLPGCGNGRRQPLHPGPVQNRGGPQRHQDRIPGGRMSGGRDGGEREHTLESRRSGDRRLADGSS